MQQAENWCGRRNFWKPTITLFEKPLTIITKHSILDVTAALDPPLALYQKLIHKNI